MPRLGANIGFLFVEMPWINSSLPKRVCIALKLDSSIRCLRSKARVNSIIWASSEGTPRE